MGDKKKKASIKPVYTDGFEELWKLYPRRVNKVSAFKAYTKVTTEWGIEHERIIDAVKRYIPYLAGPGWRPDAKHLATFLNGGCWDDEYPSAERTANRNPTYADSLKTAAENARHILNQKDDYRH